MKIYIAGPMQGYKDFNFPAFRIATTYWRNLGHEVFSPAENDEKKHGEDFSGGVKGDLTEATAKGFNLREAMADDLTWIALHADAIYMLKGWENSKGAQAEWALARVLSLNIIYQT